uniref:PB1 domain-containing protein n=2 Tax=Salix viminalis TaxID=40686 RepID=A0A6N2LFH8_SALVM
MSSRSVLGSGMVLGAAVNSSTDFDYMDELLLDGCWLETADGSEILNPNLSNSAAFFDTSFMWPSPEIKNGNPASSLSQKGSQEASRVPSLPGNSPSSDIQSRSAVGEIAVSAAGWEYNSTEGSELGRRWWIGPAPNPSPGTTVKRRLIMAVECIKDLTKNKDALIQIWVPVNRGGRRVLTTHDQPFALDPSCERLASYRDISVKYQFSAEEDSKDSVGMPGRVFLGKVPEWTPDVRFFRNDEYARVNHAQLYDVRGTLALPVFEQGSKTCLGVVEVVTTSQKINYLPELESVCKALEAVDLRCTEVPSIQNLKACDVSYQAALPDIQKVLRAACETHRLPLAQTWVSCIQQGKGGCWHSNENYYHCVSTVDDACCVGDPAFQGFLEACSEHHLLKGQGFVGEAFMTNQPCFSGDVTLYGKTEYPLSHLARIFGLCAAVAIRLRSMYTGTTDFVLEFFLPVDCRDPQEQKTMLASLSNIIQRVCQTLRVVTVKELEEETDLPVSEVLVHSGGRSSGEETLTVEESYSERNARDNSPWTACLPKVQQSGSNTSLSEKDKEKVMSCEESIESRHNQEGYSLKGSIKHGRNSTSAEGSFSSVCRTKPREKRRAKSEKTITLQVLRQYFAGSLKDAAKSIGVCPTTLKRICRQHGISRWPSRKIKKVGHSLQKLQRVIDSVEGAPASVQICSFYKNFPELASPNSSRNSPLSTLNPSSPSGMQIEGGTFRSQVAAPKSPSPSCSLSSSSSHSYSSTAQQHPSAITAAASEHPRLGENLGSGVLKVRSNAELHASILEEHKLTPRSRSHTTLSELGNRPPVPKDSSRLSQEMDGHRVKVSFGNEKIRLRIPYKWLFKDLLQEIIRRFNIDVIHRYDLKYLDDDSEWVLLTCDDDFEECIDVCGSGDNHTIKLLLEVSPHPSGRSL